MTCAVTFAAIALALAVASSADAPVAACGRRLFGEPLDHGDEPGAPGFDAEAAGASAEPDRGQAAEGDAAAGASVDQDRAAAEPGEDPERTVSGAMQALSDGSAGAPPASALERRKIAHWQQAGRYKDETVAALAELACGERILERLSREQVRRLSWLLELAVAGRVSQRTLAGALTRAARRYGGEQGAAQLERWLRGKADEVGLLGRREVA